MGMIFLNYKTSRFKQEKENPLNKYLNHVKDKLTYQLNKGIGILSIKRWLSIRRLEPKSM